MFKCFNVKGNEYPPPSLLKETSTSPPLVELCSLFYQKQIVTNILKYFNYTCIQLQGGIRSLFNTPTSPWYIQQLQSGVYTPPP